MIEPTTVSFQKLTLAMPKPTDLWEAINRGVCREWPHGSANDLTSGAHSSVLEHLADVFANAILNEQSVEQVWSRIKGRRVPTRDTGKYYVEQNEACEE